MILLLYLYMWSRIECIEHPGALNHYLHGFDALSKENVYLEDVSRRTSSSGLRYYLHIRLKDQEFRALLRPHLDLFHSNLVVNHVFKSYTKKGTVNYSEFLEGYLIDQPRSSKVIVHVKNNLITGSIEMSNGSKYYIEPSHWHIKESHGYHMIVYQFSDVKFNFTVPKNGSMAHFCGSEAHENHFEYLSQGFKATRAEEVEESIRYFKKRYSYDKKKHCSLALVADYKFFELHGYNEGSAISYMIHIIQQTNDLFKKQSFDPDESNYFEGYGFTIKYIELVTEKGGSNQSWEDSFKHVKDIYGVSEYLKIFSRRNWSKYCLAHLFTNYDFDGGTLGLAYLAKASLRKVGGICSAPFYHKNGKRLSGNTGLSTLVNYGRRLLTTELVLVNMHEFGHNFGSGHDSDNSEDCAPKKNRYVMYPAAVDGTNTNNYIFSPCSKKAINEVIRVKAASCFEEVEEAKCGNGIVEEGESCDAGIFDTSCCDSCQLTAGSHCDPANDECCGQHGTEFHCKFQLDKKCPIEQHDSCYDGRSCQYNVTADKVMCTLGDTLSDGETCFDDGRCKSGKCLDQCTIANKTVCKCTKDLDLCKLCCTDGEEGLCTPSTTSLPDGHFCGEGVCVDGICLVEAQDLQERLWHIWKDIDTDMITRWFKDNIVFTIIMFSSILWVPISIFVSILDKKYFQDEVEKMEYYHRLSIVQEIQQRRSLLYAEIESTVDYETEHEHSSLSLVPHSRESDKNVVSKNSSSVAFGIKEASVLGRSNHSKTEIERSTDPSVTLELNEIKILEDEKYFEPSLDK